MKSYNFEADKMGNVCLKYRQFDGIEVDRGDIFYLSVGEAMAMCLQLEAAISEAKKIVAAKKLTRRGEALAERQQLKEALDVLDREISDGYRP